MNKIYSFYAFKLDGAEIAPKFSVEQTQLKLFRTTSLTLLLLLLGHF